jgi:hypothetical protein
MKRVLVMVICVALTVMAVSMMTGCASQKPIDPKAFNVTGSEGATKQALILGESKDGGFMVGGSEGNVKKGIDLGEPKDGGLFVGGSEGAAKKGIQWPEPK